MCTHSSRLLLLGGLALGGLLAIAIALQLPGAGRAVADPPAPLASDPVPRADRVPEGDQQPGASGAVEPAPQDPAAPPEPTSAAPPSQASAEVPEGDASLAPEQTVWPATPSGITGAVRESLPKLRACYEEALDEVPDLSGELRLELVLDEHDGVGAIHEVAVVAGELEDPPLEDCVMDVFADLQFDPPEGGAMAITYPVHFSSSD